MQPRSSPCVFVSYSFTQSAFYCLDPSSKKNLHLSSCPIRGTCLSLLGPPSPSSTVLTSDSWCHTSLPLIRTPSPPPNSPKPQHNPATPSPSGPPGHFAHLIAPTPYPAAHTPHPPESCTSTPPGPLLTLTGPNPDPTSQPPSPLPTSPNPTPRTVTLPPTPPLPPPVYRPKTHLQNNITKPIQCLNLNATLTGQNTEQSTINQALKIPIWRPAMQREYDALFRNHTLDLVSPSPSQNLVG